MKEFLALSHGLTALYKACGRAGSSEMKGINGDMELDRFGNCWWLGSCWLQLTTSKTPDWILTGWLWSEAPGSLFIHVSPFFNLVGGVQTHNATALGHYTSAPSPKACLSNLTVDQREWAGYILTRNNNIRRNTWANIACWFNQAVTLPTFS